MNNLLEKYFEEGYVVIDPIDIQLVEKINHQFSEILEAGDWQTNSKIYSYNDSPRIVDAYKKIPEIVKFSYHSKMITILKYLYGRDPRPFSNILFKCGSEQPLHSDYVHHGTIPEGFLCGAWTALEDIKEGSGELVVVPRSHKMPYFKYSDYGLKKPASLADIKKNYSFYEEWLSSAIENLRLSSERCILKKGQTIIWDANLAHGGAPIVDVNLTRRGFVIHYTFSDVVFYNPTFSFFKGPEDYLMRDHIVF